MRIPNGDIENYPLWFIPSEIDNWVILRGDMEEVGKGAHRLRYDMLTFPEPVKDYTAPRREGLQWEPLRHEPSFLLDHPSVIHAKAQAIALLHQIHLYFPEDRWAIRLYLAEAVGDYLADKNFQQAELQNYQLKTPPYSELVKVIKDDLRKQKQQAARQKKKVEAIKTLQGQGGSH